MSGRFKMDEVVRIVSEGANRGRLGVVMHVGGEDSDYYGLRIFGVDSKPLGYFEHELQPDKRHQD